jgi:beta-N-acetylhexosaminidase
VAGCVKHIPGHGRAGADSHKALPRVDADEAALAQDLAPFRALKGAPAAMTGHILFPVWDAERPATVSPTIIQTIIRDKIGFDGLLMTDDLDMKALSGTIAEKASASLAAGCDVVLNCWGTIADMQSIAAAVPGITAQARRGWSGLWRKRRCLRRWTARFRRSCGPSAMRCWRWRARIWPRAPIPRPTGYERGDLA